MNATKPLGAVVVGTGFGVFTHLRALRNAGFEVRALVGRDPKKTAERARLFEVPRACTSLADAIRDPDIGLVTIATPPATHYRFVLEAAAAGRHILCEKPFALNLTEAREMLAAAERAGIVHLLGVEFRFATTHELLRRVIASGEIGEPRHALFTWLIPMLSDPAAEVPDWWLDAGAGGGFLGAWGSHLIDQVRITLGEFAAVSASLQTLAPKPQMTADDTFTIQFRLASGVEGVFVHSMAASGELFSLVRITGTKGAVWIEGAEVLVTDLKGNKRAIAVPTDLAYPPPVPFPHQELIRTQYEFGHSFGTDLAPYTRLFEAMRERIRGGPVPDSPPIATFRDGVEVQAVVDAMKRSSAERRWITVDRAGHHPA
jgi:predicted dehydrogenase